jgi:succinate dehydrogenase / fumarate reductase cytochrome b subunit
MLGSLRTSFTGYLTYRGGEGQVSFLLHRATGLGLLFFLTIHIVDTALVYFAPHLYEHALALYRSTPFMLGEIGLGLTTFTADEHE